MGGCFGVGATSDGRTDEVEDADRTLDVVLGLGVAFAIVGAFAFAEASVSCHASVGTGVRHADAPRGPLIVASLDPVVFLDRLEKFEVQSPWELSTILQNEV